METSAENRNKYTYLSDIYVTKSSEDTLSIELKNRTVEITFDVEDGSVFVDMTTFQSLCESDDVSLSESERKDLLEALEFVAAED